MLPSPYSLVRREPSTTTTGLIIHSRPECQEIILIVLVSAELLVEHLREASSVQEEKRISSLANRQHSPTVRLFITILDRPQRDIGLQQLYSTALIPTASIPNQILGSNRFSFLCLLSLALGPRIYPDSPSWV